MTLGARPWPKLVFLATALVFSCVAIYVYGVQFTAWLESDAAVPALLADKALHAKSPVVGDWYYANGELWVIAPHLFSLIPVALLGVGPVALQIATATGFAIELAVLFAVYRRIASERWVAVFAAIATLAVWSHAHVAYEYAQLAYGFGVCVYVVVFGASAVIALGPAARPVALARLARLALLGLLVAAFTAQSPTRALIYVIAPVLAACAWPWRAVAMRPRALVASASVAGWIAGAAVYTWLLAPVVEWSRPRGHVAFAIATWHEMAGNLERLGRGLALLCASGPAFSGSVPAWNAWAIPGALVLAGALALVGREVVSREATPVRWLGVSILTQLGLLVAVLIAGNVLDGVEAVRYLIPSLVALVAAAVIIAVRRVGDTGWWRRIATGWLITVPLATVVAARVAGPPAPVQNLWPDAGELETLAKELVHRRLTHGFANHLAANLLTLHAHGAALTCRVTIGSAMLPQPWLASSDCYTAAALPEQFYVVSYAIDHDRAALRATLPPAIDKFSVGDTYEVHVYRTEPASTAWLELPIQDGDRTVFPIRLLATHLQLYRGEVTVAGDQLVATGTPGAVVHGPYVELPKGAYTATWIGEGIESQGTLEFAVTGATVGGRRRLAPTVTLDAATVPRQHGTLVRIAFTLKRPTAGVAVIVRSAAGAKVELHSLVIERAL